MSAYALYNEIDEYAADWLENLIRLGHIAPGIVDRRSIEDIRGDDLRGFRQVHFFAGIGVWSYALRRAGVSDDTALWTGSCPCQPFSAAGKGDGMADERHLWPALLHLIRERRPERFFGEQVASKDGLGWLDLVQADMEAEGYAIGAIDTCSAGSGAPHIRQRLRICAYDLRHSAGGMAHAHSPIAEFLAREGPRPDQAEGSGSYGELDGSGDAGRLVDADGGDAGAERQQRGWEQRQQQADGLLGELADAGSGQLSQPLGRPEGRNGHGPDRSYSRPGPTNGFWRDADWVFCRDEKWRPIRPGSFPLVDGAAFRVDSGSPYAGKSRQGMLKAFGNAIDAEATIDFIDACLEHRTIELEANVVVAAGSLSLEDLLA